MSFELLDPAGWRFGEPAWLQLLWAVPAILLLYLLRRKAARVLVPHLPLWEHVLRDARRRRPHVLRTLLSILLQATILSGILVLAAAPYRVVTRPLRGHSVIVVDRSLGTRARDVGGRPLADLLLAAAGELARDCLAEGTVALGALEGGRLRVLVPATHDPRNLDLEALDLGTPRGARDAQVVADLRETAPGPETRIVLLTPFAPDAEGRRVLEEADVTVLAVGRPGANAGIRAVNRVAAGLSVMVQGAGPERRLRLLQDSGPLVEKTVVPTAAGVRVDLALPADAALRVTLELSPPDAFPPDDRAHVVVPERERLRVLVVAAGRTPHLDAWLAASAWVDRQGSGRLLPADFGAMPTDHDVVILVDQLRERPLPEGRYLLLGSAAPGLPLHVDAERTETAQPVSWKKADPLVHALDLAAWVVHRVHPVRAERGLDVVVEGSSGPLIGRGGTERLRFVFLAVGPDSAASSLPLMAAFPLFLEAALEELAGRAGWPAAPVLRAGGEIVLLPGEEPALLGAAGSRLVLEANAAGTGWRLPETSGHFLVAGPGKPRAVGLAILDHAGIPGAPAEARRVVPPFPSQEREEPLRAPLALALLVLLLIEWLAWQLMLTE